MMGESTGFGRISLRDTTDADMQPLFEQQRHPEACRMAAFPSREWDAFAAHWHKISRDPTLTRKTILCDGQVAGSMGCFPLCGSPAVGYWIGREYWGRGIATRALREFLGLVSVWPLQARVAKHNIASIRVLEKCGFARRGEDAMPPGSHGEAVEEWVYELRG